MSNETNTNQMGTLKGQTLNINGSSAKVLFHNSPTRIFVSWIDRYFSEWLTVDRCIFCNKLHIAGESCECNYK